MINKSIVIQTLISLKQFLVSHEYASCFKQRLGEGYALIHTPRRILTNANQISEKLVSFFGDNKSLDQNECETLFGSELFQKLIEMDFLRENPKSRRLVSKNRIIPINQFFVLIPFRAFAQPPVYIGADSLTFFRNIWFEKIPKKVLDLATGSGFQLFGLPWHGGGTSMIGLDINPNAIEIAKTNSTINNTDWVKFYEHDITKSMEFLSTKFDLIIGNPPIIPTSKLINTRLRGMIHADGGPDGFEVVRKLIPNSLDILNPDGSLQLILSSLGNDQPSIINELDKIIQHEYLDANLVILKKIPVELDSYYRGQNNKSEYQQWMKFYKDQGYKNWFRAIIRFRKSNKSSKLVYKSLIRMDFDSPPNRERLTLNSIKHRIKFYLIDTLMQKSSDNEITKATEIIYNEIDRKNPMQVPIVEYGKYLFQRYPDIFFTEGASIRFWGQCTNEFWWKPKYLERILW